MGLDAFVRCRCFLHTGQGWLSLATVIDPDARMVAPAAATTTRWQSPSSRPSKTRCTVAARLPRARGRGSP